MLQGFSGLSGVGDEEGSNTSLTRRLCRQSLEPRQKDKTSKADGTMPRFGEKRTQALPETIQILRGPEGDVSENVEFSSGSTEPWGFALAGQKDRNRSQLGVLLSVLVS